MNHHLGNIYQFAERYDDAIKQADKLLEMDPQMRISIELKAWATGLRGDWQEALKLFEKVNRLTNHPLKGLMGLGYAYGMLGNIDKAMECIKKLEQRQIEEPDSVIDTDLVAVWVGRRKLRQSVLSHPTVYRKANVTNKFLHSISAFQSP